jgi:phospholipase C
MFRMKSSLRALIGAATLASVTAAINASTQRNPARSTASLVDIQNIIIIYQENWSFDSLYGLFPGANGLANAKKTVNQVDPDGKKYSVLPQPLDTRTRPVIPDPRFPATLPVAPFDLTTYVSPDEQTGDLRHRFYYQQLQIDNGKMDKFVAWSDAAGLVMSYYDGSDFPEGKLAREFTLADNFFHAAFGGSFLNHFWLICACTPVWPDAPEDIKIQVNKKGEVLKDGIVTEDGFAVNTSYPLDHPFPLSAEDPTHRVPRQTAPTIGDRLTERNISWRWYSGGYNDAIAGKADPLFQYHHQPFIYFEKYADATPAKAEFLKDEQDFYEDLKNGKLPSVSFIKLMGLDNEHPGYASLMRGQERVAHIVDLVRQSPYWAGSAIFIVYDENGGRWDHVPPPKVDRWGPGVRVPAIIISPFAKKHYVDHTQYDTTSLLAFIERRWNLRPLSDRDARVNNLTSAFEFGR